MTDIHSAEHISKVLRDIQSRIPPLLIKNAVNEMPLTPTISMVMEKALESDEVSEEAMKLGATDYAVKPLDLRVISLKFSNILKKRGQRISKI